MADFVCCSPCLHGNGNRAKDFSQAMQNSISWDDETLYNFFIHKRTRERLNKYFNSVAFMWVLRDGKVNIEESAEGNANLFFVFGALVRFNGASIFDISHFSAM